MVKVVYCYKRDSEIFDFLVGLFISPVQWVDEMAEAGANQYTFHIEATSENCIIIHVQLYIIVSVVLLSHFSASENPSDLIKKIKATGMKVYTHV